MEPSQESSKAHRWAYPAAAATVIVWSTSATVTKSVLRDWAAPAFLFYLLGFAALAAVAFELIRRRGRIGPIFRVPPRLYALGLFGLFGLALFYVEAYRYGTAVEVNLINHLWPLLIVVFAVVILREPAGWPLFAGAGVCLAGLVLLLAGGKPLAFRPAQWLGYLLALCYAITRGLFGVLQRKFGGPMHRRGQSNTCLFLLIALAAASVNYALRGPHAWPSPIQLGAAAYIGVMIFMVGLLLWEFALRNGRAAIVGLIGYFTPLGATVLLWVVGGEPFTWWALVGALCVTGGAMLPLLLLRRPEAEPIVRDG